MNIENKKGKIIGSGSKSGTSIIRAGGEIFGIQSRGKISQLSNVWEYKEPAESPEPTLRASRGIAYNSSISCGGRSGTGSGYFPAQPDKPAGMPSISHRMQDVPSEEPPPAEGDTCPDVGFILATVSGYYILVIGDLLQDAELRYLGSSETDICITDNVGRVERHEGGYSGCMPARWDFLDGVRYVSISEDYDLQASTPFLWSEETENFTGYYKDFVYTPHYGYTDKHQGYSIGGLGGCAIALGSRWYSQGAVFTAEYKREFYLHNSVGFDSNDFGYGTSSCRIQQLNVPRACPTTPELPSGNKTARLLNLVNHERYCIAFTDEIVEMGSLTTACAEYAAIMADNNFLNKVNLLNGETVADRLDNAEIPYQLVYEFVQLIDNPGLPDPTENLDKACDDFFNGVKSNQDDWEKLVSAEYFKIGFGLEYSADNDKWHGYIIIIKQSGDELTVYPESSIYLPDTQDFVDPDVYIDCIDKGNNFRAFSTYPKTINKINCSGSQWWDGYVAYFGYQVAIKDNGEYPLNSDTITFLENGLPDPNPVSGLGTTKIASWPPALLTNGSKINPPLYTEYSDFYIQYDTGRPVFVRIYGSNESVDSNINPDPAPGYERESCLPADGESANPLGGESRGKTELHVGNLTTDNSHRFGQGILANPFQAITVGSVFHTSSGYTGITYTLPITVNSTHYQWSANWAECHELYYWMRYELWAAVIGPTNELVARWQLGGVDPRNGENPIYETKYYLYDIEAPQQNFTYYMNSAIKKKTFKIYVIIDGYTIYAEEQENSETHELYLKEIANQHPDYEYVFQSYSINYETGEIQFSLVKSIDLGKTLTIIVDLSKYKLYENFEIYTEIAGYVGFSSGRNSRLLLPHYTIETAGIMMRFGELTVTEDGETAIFACKPTYLTSNRNSRILFNEDLPDAPPDSFEPQFTEIKTHAVAYDLTQLEANVPKRLNDPRFLTNDSGYTDCVVLN